MSKLFLSGGGGKEQARSLDERFAGLIDGKRVMYIPIALERDSIGFEACFDWITDVFAQFEYKIEAPQIEMFLDPKVIRERMSEYDAVYIGGGNTFKLLQILYENNIIEEIRRFLNDGKIIYGGSAGAIIFGKDINTVAEENDGGYLYTEGLNMLGGRSLVCHWKGDRSAIDDGVVIRLREEEGIIVEDGEMTYVV